MVELLKEYATWLKKETTVERKNDNYILTVPYMDHHNDDMQIYVTKCGEKIALTDDGYILSNLQIAGISMSPDRMKLIQRTCNNCSVKLSGQELITETLVHNFSQDFHLFLQAMMKIDAMFTLLM